MSKPNVACAAAPAQAWTDKQGADLLYITTCIPKSHPAVAEVWHAAEAFALSEHAIERTRLRREVAKVRPVVEQWNAGEILRLRRQLEGLRGTNERRT